MKLPQLLDEPDDVTELFSHSQPLADKELEGFTAQLSQNQ
jgi:hypothetical protein